ncbi:hypothetical protein N0V90_008440 [Kalmusia sp. IMI 367209]|nr:hypothetical protein N0V90_008440 [Kalmusia sp. IMI 367209]
MSDRLERSASPLHKQMLSPKLLPTSRFDTPEPTGVVAQVEEKHLALPALPPANRRTDDHMCEDLGALENPAKLTIAGPQALVLHVTTDQNGQKTDYANAFVSIPTPEFAVVEHTSSPKHDNIIDVSKDSADPSASTTTGGINSAKTSSEQSHESPASKKRKLSKAGRSDGSSLNLKPPPIESFADQNTPRAGAQPAVKKRKTSSSSTEAFMELGESSENEVVVPTVKRSQKATVTKGTIKKAGAAGIVKPQRPPKLSKLDRAIFKDEKKHTARPNQRNALVAKMMKDHKQMSRMTNRNRPVDPDKFWEGKTKPPAGAHIPDGPDPFRFKKVREHQKDMIATEEAQKKDYTRTAIGKRGGILIAPAQDAVVIDENDPNVRIVSLKTIRFLRVRPLVSARLSNILATPEEYPNVNITFDTDGKPIQARVTTMSDEQFAEARIAAITRAREQKKLEKQLARQTKRQVASLGWGRRTRNT